jgi:hypothetical protein
MTVLPDFLFLDFRTSVLLDFCFSLSLSLFLHVYELSVGVVEFIL